MMKHSANPTGDTPRASPSMNNPHNGGPSGAPREIPSGISDEGLEESPERSATVEPFEGAAGEEPADERQSVAGEAQERHTSGGEKAGKSVCSPHEAAVSTPADIEKACRQTFVFGNHKAGMDLTEEERGRIAAKIFELSRHSPFYANEMRKSRQLDEQIAILRRRQQVFLSSGGCAAAAATARRVLHGLHQRQQRDAGRVYVHLDMDMFFCAVEMRDDPSLVSVPMAVGSLSMLATANYAARRYGVRSAMPGFIAKKLCPSLVIIRPNFDKYRQAGALIRQVLATYDPGLSSHSLDEASLDVTDFLKSREELEAASSSSCAVDLTCDAEDASAAAEIAAAVAARRVAALVSEIRAAVFAATGLTCSAGAAPSRLVAKIASDVNKPNGQKIITPTPIPAAAAAAAAASGNAAAAPPTPGSSAAGEASAPAAEAETSALDTDAVGPFLESLEVRKLPGVGKHREKLLHGLEIHTCGQMIQQAPLLLYLLPRVTAVHLLRLALGLDGSDPQHQQHQPQQSISSEETFAATDELPVLRQVIEQLAAAVAEQLRDMKQETDHVSIKVKFADFSLKTTSHRLAEHTDDAQMIATAALALLQAILRDKKLKKQTHSSGGSNGGGGTQGKGTETWVRLLGVRCSGLRDSKAKNSNTRRLDEFFSVRQQQQQQQQQLAAAADTESSAERDSRIEVSELDDLLAALSQQSQQVDTSAVAPARANAAVEGAAATEGAMVTAPTTHTAAEVSTGASVNPKCDFDGEVAAASAVVAATDAPAAASAAASAVREPTAASSFQTIKPTNKERSSSKSSKSSGNNQRSQQLLLNLLSQQKQRQHQLQQRRRCPSPPIHRQLKQQKRHQAAQQKQQRLLALLREPKQHQHQQKQKQQHQLRSGWKAPPNDNEVVEIVSD